MSCLKTQGLPGYRSGFFDSPALGVSAESKVESGTGNAGGDINVQSSKRLFSATALKTTREARVLPLL